MQKSTYTQLPLYDISSDSLTLPESEQTPKRSARQRCWLICVLFFALALVAVTSRDMLPRAAEDLRKHFQFSWSDIETACNVTELDFGLVDDSLSWHVEASAVEDGTYYVRPLEQLRNATAHQPGCLANAIFSARILSTGTNDTVYYALPHPQYLQNGVYRFHTPSNVQLPLGNYTLQVLLEFGYLQGGRDATLCGQSYCDPTELAQVSSPRFVGKPVLSYPAREPLVPTVDQVAPSTLPLCEPHDFEDLVGYWHAGLYQPFVCRLMDAHDAFTLPLSSARQKPFWIQMIGDSNTRNVFANMRDMMVPWLVGEYVSARGTDGHDNLDRPVFMTSLYSFGAKKGQELQAGDIDLILTFTCVFVYECLWTRVKGIRWSSWWYPTEDLQMWTQDARRLVTLVDASIVDLLDMHGITDGQAKGHSVVTKVLESHDWRHQWGAITQTRTFISFGSHAVGLNRHGYQEMVTRILDELEDEDLLSSDVSSERNLFFVQTTSVKVQLIPLRRFPNQDMVRNAITIGALNDALMQDPRSGNKMIRFDTDAIAFEERRDNAVHFPQPDVYDSWANIYLTAFMAGLQV